MDKIDDQIGEMVESRIYIGSRQGGAAIKAGEISPISPHICLPPTLGMGQLGRRRWAAFTALDHQNMSVIYNVSELIYGISR